MVLAQFLGIHIINLILSNLIDFYQSICNIWGLFSYIFSIYLLSFKNSILFFQLF